ncbi:MAG TPA: hypothetical protein PLN21_00435 [Gemmatales bacterium]|nr:hypothetical protein [Gemmatales bacterium]
MSDQVKSKKKDQVAAKTVATPPVRPQITVADELDGSPPLTPELLASYQDSHYRLLLVLGLVLAFILACFPISDPEIFFSLQTGKMVSSGEFPWGTDPYGFADGLQAPWAHTGWLGDLTIYGLYQAGGGPLLVFVRALLLVFLFWLLLQMGEQKSPHLRTVVVVLLGILTISHRLYFRTELFSFVLLGITLWALAYRPRTDGWLGRFHQLTAGRCYWLLPLVFLLWVNLDSWFFFGLGSVILWCAGSWLKSKEGDARQLRALTITTLVCVAVSFVNPFHVRAFTQIPALLITPTATELDARFIEQKQRNPNSPMTEHQRLFASPWTKEFFNIERNETIHGMPGQAPALPFCYPMGMSISEWAYYPLMIVVALSLIASRLSWSSSLILLIFAVLSIWQSRFIGFFAVGGVAMALMRFQSQPQKLPSLNRLSILASQSLCLFIGLTLQIISLLHLIPTPDPSSSAALPLTPTPDTSPSAFGHVHPRGSFGFSFRQDASIVEACEEVNRWRAMQQVAGNPFHFDWTEVTGYDVWFNPGGRHFFDTRLAVHSVATTQAYFATHDALMGVILDPLKLDGSNLNAVLARQEAWQRYFKTYDISYLIVKRHEQRNGEQVYSLVRSLLLERDKDRQPVWKALRLHNGQIFALAWVGSPHWEKMKKLAFDPGDSIFRQRRQTVDINSKWAEKESLSKFLRADPPRKPVALEEIDWYRLQYQDEFYQPGYPQEPLAVMLEHFRDEQMRTMAASLGSRLAAPMNQLPYVPLWLSFRHSSASILYLGLDAARRANAALSIDAPVNYRYEAATKYLQAASAVNQYEAAITAVAQSYREPQLLYLLRKVAGIALEAGQANDAIEKNLQLAQIYLQSGALDAGLEQYLLVRGFIERLKPEQAEARIKKLDEYCKQKHGFVPEVLQNEIKKRIEAWQRQVAQLGWAPHEGETIDNVLNRAKLALQIGLPRRALDELLTAGVKSVQGLQLAIQIYSMLGHYDLAWQELIQKSPELRTSLQPYQLHQLGALGEWVLGHPELAAQHRVALSKLMDESGAKSAIFGGQYLLQGASDKGISNVFLGNNLLQEGMRSSFEIANEKIESGLLQLEAGQPEQAANLFREAILDIEPNSPWRPLVERYYFQITGQVLK